MLQIIASLVSSSYLSILSSTGYNGQNKFKDLPSFLPYKDEEEGMRIGVIYNLISQGFVWFLFQLIFQDKKINIKLMGTCLIIRMKI